MIAFTEPYSMKGSLLKDLPYIKNFQETIMEQLATDAAKKEEMLLTDALRKHLGRLIFVEDAKDCEMVTTPDMPIGCYFFCHKGVKLGYMEKSELKFTNENGTDFVDNNYRLYVEMRFISS